MIDLLTICAHPDDMELSAAGTIISAVQEGKKVVMVELTQGELGTRGNAELRKLEAAKAAQILGVQHRENLGLKDGFFTKNQESLMVVIEVIRRFKPEILITNTPTDRHPDHGKAYDLVNEASFLAGLRKIETFDKSTGQQQTAHRPRLVLGAIQDFFLSPDITVDITAHWDKKMESIMAYSSQFYNPKSNEPESPISSKEFLDFLQGRAMELGRPIGVKYAEGFKVNRALGVDNIFNLR